MRPPNLPPLFPPAGPSRLPSAPPLPMQPARHFFEEGPAYTINDPEGVSIEINKPEFGVITFD